MSHWGEEGWAKGVALDGEFCMCEEGRGQPGQRPGITNGMEAGRA